MLKEDVYSTVVYSTPVTSRPALNQKDDRELGSYESSEDHLETRTGTAPLDLTDAMRKAVGSVPDKNFDVDASRAPYPGRDASGSSLTGSTQLSSSGIGTSLRDGHRQVPSTGQKRAPNAWKRDDAFKRAITDPRKPTKAAFDSERAVSAFA